MSDQAEPKRHWFRALSPYAVYLFLAGTGLILLMVLVGTTSVPTPTTTQPGKVSSPKKEPFDDPFRKGTDLASCRQAVTRLNAWIRANPEQRPRPLSTDEAVYVRKQFFASEAEMNEVGRRLFTPLDAHYLDRCFLFRDVARSLDVNEAPALERAQAAFDWMVRHVQLRQIQEITPAHLVVRRGWGREVDRAQVYCALLEQLNVPACLVLTQVKDRTFYIGCGTLADGKIYMFDTLHGVPFPDERGTGIATLQELQDRPALIKQLAVDPKHDFHAMAPLVKQSQAFIVCSLSALAPRMSWLEKKLSPKQRVKLSADARQLAKAFDQAAGGKVPFHSYNIQSPSRLLRTYLPVNEGGVDPSVPKQLNRSQRFQFSVLPVGLLPEPVVDQLQSSSLGRKSFYEHFEHPFYGLILNPGSPRDRLVRGNLDDATREISSFLDLLAKIQAQVGSAKDLSRAMETWCEQARLLDAELLRARQESPDGSSPAIEASAAKLQEHWKRHKPVQLSLMAAVGERLVLEAEYLLALCKHEQAERLARQLKLAKAPDPELEKAVKAAWQAAADMWHKHRRRFPKGFPEARIWHARTLAALGDTDAARRILENPPENLGKWTRWSFQYRAKQLGK